MSSAEGGTDVNLKYLPGLLAALWVTVLPVLAPSAPAVPEPLPVKAAVLRQPLPQVPLKELPAEEFPAEEPGEPEESLPPEEDGAFTIVLSFTGDMLLASGHGQRAAGNFLDYAAKQEPFYFLQNVKPIFDADDFTIVNLENVLTDRTLTPREKTTDPAFWFRSGTRNTAVLTSSGVEAVSLANNHTGDYGAGGYKDTVKAVTDAGLQYGDNTHPLYLEKNGFRIAVICNGLWNEGQAVSIVKRLQAAEAESDFQIVFYHGGKEGVHTPEAWKVRASRRLVDAGADLVLGNHPHVLQPREIYKDREILYSLGNFCYGGSRYPQNRTLIYQLTLTVRDGALVSAASELIPCYVYTGKVNNYCPALITDEAQCQRVLDFMDGKLKSPC